MIETLEYVQGVHGVKGVHISPSKISEECHSNISSLIYFVHLVNLVTDGVCLTMY